jgi:hypothetical protein
MFSPRAIASASLGNLRDTGPAIYTVPVTPRGEALAPLEITNAGNQPIKESSSAQRFGMRNSISRLPAVSEVVNKKDDFGIDGYFIPNFNAALDKPLTYRFSPTKNRKTFIDFAVKQKEFMPGSTRYNTSRSLLDPKKGLMTTKGKRKMLSEEIEE